MPSRPPRLGTTSCPSCVPSSSSSRLVDPARPSHGRVAWCYETLAALYSGGAIAAAKASQIEELQAGDRVLYVGVGSGEDALLAAERGVRLSALDVSRRMLESLSRRLTRSGLQGELLREDLFSHARFECYDAVAANFVLNVFPPVLMEQAITRLTALLRPGGLLLVADFSPPRGGALRRSLARAYYRPVNVAAWALRLCSLHPIYDYTRRFEPLGLALLRRREFRIFGRGPAAFESLVAEKIR